MASRMERYYKPESKTKRRTVANQELYRKIYDISEYSNIEGIATIEKANEIDITKVKKMLKNREEYQKQRDLRTLINREEPKVQHIETTDDFDDDSNRIYDISDILQKAKEEKSEPVEKYRSLGDTNYNILKSLKVKSETEKFVESELEKTLTNTSILSFLENNAGKHSSKIGKNLISENCTWMLLSWKVEIIKRPKFNDIIRVKTWSRKIEKFYAYRDFEVFNSQGELVAVASSKWVYIDIEKRKIIKVPQEVADSYDSENVFAFGEEESEFSKLKEPETYEKEIEFFITRNMIDTNKHLHNIYYLDIVKEVLPQELYEGHEFDYFEIMYKKEIKYGEIPKVFYVKQDNEHIVTIKSNDESEIHAIIMMK